MSLRIIQRVQVAHHSLHSFVEHMRIDLCRRNIGMTEQFLDDAQIGAILQQMAGEGVAQHVRADPRRRDSCRSGNGLEVAGEKLAAQIPASALRRKQPGTRRSGRVDRFEQAAIEGHRLPRRF